MLSDVAATSAAIALRGLAINDDDDDDANDLSFGLSGLLRWKLDGFGEKHRSGFEGSDDFLACISLEGEKNRGFEQGASGRNACSVAIFGSPEQEGALLAAFY